MIPDPEVLKVLPDKIRHLEARMARLEDRLEVAERGGSRLFSLTPINLALMSTLVVLFIMVTQNRTPHAA